MSVFYRNPDNRVEIDLLVRREDTLLWSPDGRLPHYEPREHHLGEVGHLGRWARETLGLEIAILRALPDREEGNLVRRAYEAENLGGDAPPGWTWSADPPPGLEPLALERTLDVLSSAPASRRAWARPGWHAGTLSWLEGVLPGPVRVEQRRNWERSCVLRVEAGGRVYYAKTPASVLAHEGPLTAALRAQLPSRFPEVLVSRDDGTFVLAELPPSLDRKPDQAVWEAVLEAYANAQRVLAADLPPVVPARPPEEGLAQLEASVAMAGDRLPVGQRDRLLAARSSLDGALAGLLELGLPTTWAHGDFWAGNVTCDGVFFDLSDDSATHPFLSLPWFIATPPAGLDAARLLDAYLGGWAAFAPLERLRRAYQAAEPIAYLHAADFYARTLLPSLEARWEMEEMLPYYLSRAAATADN